ncbi:MAG: type I DNA topoisomerase [Candidatus Omnitrophota bacterium]|jgi:DNA topoisomerase-1
MGKKSLVIVESPTKAKTIGRILGTEFTVIPSMGHLIDLPTSKLGIDVDKDFEPHYIVIKGRTKILSTIKKEAKADKEVFIATDPDREGEAVGWHIKNKLPKDKKIQRVIFHEITPEAIKEAFSHPRDFDVNMVEAQAARRILDRIVGYFLSPLLWRKISRGLSAGRVQSVALRLIVERERLIQAFIPQEYWEIEAELAKTTGEKFIAKLDKIAGEKAALKNKEETDNLLEDVKSKVFKVSDIKETEKKRNPLPPFITSTLQQDAFNKLRFSASKTMLLAQQLYEGIEIGSRGLVGLITYMRTDSTNVAASALSEARTFISRTFGDDYLPEKPNVYKSKKLAQEAHEAIRPSSAGYTPDSIQEFLNKDQHKLYTLIYNRFLASQMTPSRYKVTSAVIEAGQYIFSASGTRVIFDGFMRLYNKEDEEKKTLPGLQKDELLELLNLIPSQHFTQPPPRYSDGSLVKALEELGIGRPSTYAPIIYTIVTRDYVNRMKGYLQPTELGFKVCDMLVEYFSKVMDYKFTAEMEEELDGVEEGKFDRVKVLRDFYPSFKTDLEHAQNTIVKEVIFSDQVCDKCGKPMMVKWGKRGKFLSCSGFPQCKNSKSITTGVKCPQENCGGELILRRSRRGTFYGCSNFPACHFISKDLPGSNPAEDKDNPAA